MSAGNISPGTAGGSGPQVFAATQTPRVKGRARPGFRSDLLEQVLAFNLCWPERLHPSWVGLHEAFWRTHLQRLREPGSRAQVSAWIRRHFGLEGQYDDDFARVEKRVHLVDFHQLQDLARWVGASLAVASIRRVLDREQVLALRQALGEREHRELLVQFCDGYDAGVLVAVDDAVLQPSGLYDLGARALGVAASAWGPGVARRTELGLDARCVQSPGCMVLLEDADLLHQHLLRVARLFLPGGANLWWDRDEEMAA